MEGMGSAWLIQRGSGLNEEQPAVYPHVTRNGAPYEPSLAARCVLQRGLNRAQARETGVNDAADSSPKLASSHHRLDRPWRDG